MAGPSFEEQLRERFAQAAEIQNGLDNCASDMSETVTRTKLVIGDSRDLITQVDKLLARSRPGDRF